MGGLEGEGGEHNSPGRTWALACVQVYCGHLEAHLRVKPMPKNSINIESPGNNPRSKLSPPQASVAMKTHSRPRSGSLLEREIITGGHVHHPGGHHDEEGVVHPRG